MIASLVLPLLRLIDPERAHGLALRALSLGLVGMDTTPDDPVLAVTAFGLTFRNPIGLAAGFIEPLIREHAAWAVEQIRARVGLP